ncbi:MAG: hypothetical protein HS111_03015 [Kofleriaceae bacterium]|nr:hypothetical protein [Kofleriaceae bacterium]
MPSATVAASTRSRPTTSDGGAGRRAQLYVTPGVGFSGVRVRDAGDGARAEVALFTLRAGVPGRQDGRFGR